MDRGRTVVALGLVAAMLAPAEAWAARRDSSDWIRVQALDHGTGLVVRLRDGSEVKGRLASADGGQVTLLDGKGQRVLARADVVEVRKGKRSLARKIGGVLVGAVVGAFTGAYTGASIGYSSSSGEDAGLFGAVYGFLIGAVVGGIAGGILASKGGGAVVYWAP